MAQNKKKVVRVIDCNGGNGNVVARLIREKLAYTVRMANGPKDLSEATHVILTGVGATRTIMSSLNSKGLIPKLEKIIFRKGVFFLATGVAMQLLFDESKDAPPGSIVPCLGWLPGTVEKYDTEQPFAPKIGVSGCVFVKETPITTVNQCEEFYFHTNGHHVRPSNPSDIWAWADNDVDYVAAVQRDNIYGVQFRMEKGIGASRRLLEDFLELEKEEVKKEAVKKEE